ncbi:hypothetical protein SDC9_59341 [bioreactor metagenome]|uniref:Uncharacterized protein n=1 Tax=bioreactor metagenome TaxID=1076179 RepID=A0A644X9W0_9ZZZZ
MGSLRPKEYFWSSTESNRNAIRSRSSRRCTWFFSSGGANYHLYGLSRFTIDDSQYVQNCRRNATYGVPCIGSSGSSPCFIHLWRPSGCDGCSSNRICHVGFCICSRSDGFGFSGTSGNSKSKYSIPSFFRWVPYFSRNTKN